jgi:succinate dehydrogenase / fumarate reductase flavoprotein subunit
MFEYGYATNDGELASRDVVARAELTEVNEGRGVNDEYVHLDMRHLGEERITDRLENILHLAEDFEGVNGLEEPMPVKPGQHYAMGGVEVNEFGETCIDGLYAAGECACVSLHGANRLGGNALPELIVFGALAGRHAAGSDLGEPDIETGFYEGADREEIDVPTGEPSGEPVEPTADGGAQTPEAVIEQAVDVENERIETLLEREDGVNHADVRANVQQSMTENVNVFREEEGLKQALRDVRAARERYQDVYVADKSRTFNTDLQHTIETRNLLDVAEAITMGALARDEFRGAHWRAQHQERKDDEWLKHTLVSWNDGDPQLWYRPALLEGDEKTYEPKVRSY